MGLWRTGAIHARSGSDSGFCEPAAVAKTAAAPEVDFTIWGGPLTGRTVAHAMNIRPTGVLGPDAGCTVERRCAAGVVLLNPQITHLMASTVEGGDQLRFVVKQSLPPLGMAGSHRQHPPLKGERSAMGCQAFTGNAGPVLPKRCQAAVPPPILAKTIEAVTER